MKLEPVSVDGASYGWAHWCPGCKDHHVIPTSGPKVWRFNGDLERPTFTPSVRLTWNWGSVGGPDEPHCCHYVITDGAIQFCGDCTHALAGQTVPLPEIPEQPA